jgi:hypothetical protein
LFAKSNDDIIAGNDVIPEQAGIQLYGYWMLLLIIKYFL